MASWRRLALAAAGGVLCFLGYAGFGIWPLSLVCLALLWEAVETPSARPPARGALFSAALSGFVYGFVAYAGGFHWMWRIVDVFLGGNLVLGALLFGLDASWFGLRFALYAATYAAIRRRGWPIALAGVAPLVVVEWVWPAIFPVYLGHSLAGQLEIVQISDLGGPLLLTALMALLNAAVFEAWRWRRGRAESRRAMAWTCAAALLCAVGAVVYGSARLRQLESAVAAAPQIGVGVVQGNLGVLEKGRHATLDHRSYLEQTRELLSSGDVDLIVWPETVYSSGLQRPLPLSGDLIRGDLRVPLLFGAASVSGESGMRLRYNSALLVGEDGVIRDAYDKNLLIPFTEYVPFAEVLPGAQAFAGASRFSPGTTMPALGLGAWRISTPICSEAIEPTYVRRMVAAAQPHLLVTLVNDSWFGDSQEPRLHLTMARMRAVEHRRYVVRAANSGISAVIDPAGRVIARSQLLQRENLRAAVRPLDVVSPYTRWGDWPGWLGLMMTAVALVGRGFHPPPTRPQDA